MVDNNRGTLPGGFMLFLLGAVVGLFAGVFVPATVKTALVAFVTNLWNKITKKKKTS